MISENDEANSERQIDLNRQMRNHLVLRSVRSKIIVYRLHVRTLEKLPFDIRDDNKVPVVPVRSIYDMRNRPGTNQHNQCRGVIERDKPLVAADLLTYSKNRKGCNDYRDGLPNDR